MTSMNRSALLWAGLLTTILALTGCGEGPDMIVDGGPCQNTPHLCPPDSAMSDGSICVPFGDEADNCTDNVDNDCNGTVDDDAPGAPVWHHDVDGDGFPNASAGCNPGGLQIDCDDNEYRSFPGAPDKCGDGPQDVLVHWLTTPNWRKVAPRRPLCPEERMLRSSVGLATDAGSTIFATECMAWTSASRRSGDEEPGTHDTNWSSNSLRPWERWNTFPRS